MAEDDVRKGCLEDVTSELRPPPTKEMKRQGKSAEVCRASETAQAKV